MDPTPPPPPLDIWLLLERERGRKEEGEEEAATDRRDPLASRVLSTYRSLLNTHEQSSKTTFSLLDPQFE